MRLETLSALQSRFVIARVAPKLFPNFFKPVTIVLYGYLSMVLIKISLLVISREAHYNCDLLCNQTALSNNQIYWSIDGLNSDILNHLVQSYTFTCI